MLVRIALRLGMKNAPCECFCGCPYQYRLPLTSQTLLSLHTHARQVSTGAVDDIRRCSSLAYQTVSEFRSQRGRGACVHILPQQWQR